METLARPPLSPIELPTEDNPAVLIHGDCRDTLARLPAGTVDALVSDPPYGMDWDTDSTRFTGGKGSHKKKSARVTGDAEPFDPSPWLAFPKVCLWGSNHYAARLPVGSSLVWVKKSPGKLGQFLSDAEVGWQKGGHGVYVFWHVWDGCARESENGQHYHPTQKPVALMRWVLGRLGLEPGDTVFDPYMGSGTTGVACLQMGLRFIGCEIDAGHYATARRRLDDALGVGGLFSPERPAEPAGLFA